MNKSHNHLKDKSHDRNGSLGNPRRSKSIKVFVSSRNSTTGETSEAISASVSSLDQTAQGCIDIAHEAEEIPATERSGDLSGNPQKPDLSYPIKSQVALHANDIGHSLLAKFRPISAGLIIYLVKDPTCNLHTVRQAVIPLVTESSQVLGIPTSKTSVIYSLISGNPRQIEHAEIMLAATTPLFSGVPCHVEYIQALDKLIWTNQEGHLILFRHFNAVKGGCLIVDQVISGSATLDLVLGLDRISTKSKEADVQVIMIVCAPAALIPAIKQVSDEYFEVSPCEADLGVQTAFSIDYPSISGLGIGLGKVMCSIKYADGKFHYSYTPFISDSLDKRIVWTMRGQGQTLEEIGARLKINKSTVLRRLKDLPPRRRLKDAEEWLSPYFEATSRGVVANPDCSTLDADWDDGNPSGDADGA